VQDDIARAIASRLRVMILSVEASSKRYGHVNSRPIPAGQSTGRTPHHEGFVR